jgi:hypothetical protein
MKKAEAVLGPMLKRLGIESGVRLERIRTDWFSIFEADLSSHMYPASCADRELLLNVDSPVWMQQLTYYRKDNIGKLGPYGIANVRFRIGKLQKKKQQQGRKKVRQLSADDLSFASSVVSDIADEQLKESIRKAIEKSLTVIRHP